MIDFSASPRFPREPELKPPMTKQDRESAKARKLEMDVRQPCPVNISFAFFSFRAFAILLGEKQNNSVAAVPRWVSSVASPSLVPAEPGCVSSILQALSFFAS